MKNWDIPNMIIEIKKPIIPGMDIPRKRYKNKETVAKHTACIMFDLNNLKIINDSKGHSDRKSVV